MATIRIDDELKHNADKMFDEVGINTLIAGEMFLNRFVKTGKFPFDIEIIFISRILKHCGCTQFKCNSCKRMQIISRKLCCN